MGRLSLLILLLTTTAFGIDVSPEFPGRIIGDTDSTKIGNISDRLKVTSQPTHIPGNVSSLSNDLRYDDMNATTGGIARDTSVSPSDWVRLYNYSGSGYLFGLIINLESNTDWYIRLVVDSTEIFTSSGISSTDMTSDVIYDLDVLKDQRDESLGMFWDGTTDKFIFNVPKSFPMRYDSSIAVWVKRVSSSKKFRAGLIVLSKE